MKLKVVQWVLALLLLAPCTQAQSIWDATHLANVKQSIHEPFYATAYQALQAEADKLLDVQPLSVMMKEKVPASGNKHDYMSQARYYWPDPTKPDGLPYVSRDGESNPELNKLDRNRLGATDVESNKQYDVLINNVCRSQSISAVPPHEKGRQCYCNHFSPGLNTDWQSK